MELSYLLRVICLALCSAGMLQAVLGWTAWAAAPLVLRQRHASSARRTERALFLLLLAARFGPWFLVCGFLVPAYVRGEDNSSTERVGLACLAAAACVLFWMLARLVRSLAAAYSAHRYCRRCDALTPSSLRLPAFLSPAFLSPGERPILAVAGVFSTKVIVSRSLLNTARFSAAGLEVAFAHEAAHVRHRDNLKLFFLSLFPNIPFSTTDRPSLEQRWRLAAELAADEEGVQGEPERCLALAQVLVTMAREADGSATRGMMALLSASEHLNARVERLLAPRTSPSSAESSRREERHGFRWLLPFAASAVILAVLSSLCILFGHRAAEVLLHLG